MNTGKPRHMAVAGLLLCASLVCMFPFCAAAVGSFAREGGGPFAVTLRQYGEVLLLNKAFYIWFWNSVLTVGGILCINLPVSLLAGYAFSQYRFRGRNAVFFLYILLMLMPFQATIVPQYLTLHALGLLNSLAAIILPNAFSAFGAFLMTQYMKGIDRELLEAGKMDGLNEFTVFLRVAVPLCRPAIAALVILLMLENWSMVEQPVAFLQNVALFPLSVQLNSAGFGAGALAGGVVFSILPILVYLYGYRDLVDGISLSCIK